MRLLYHLSIALFHLGIHVFSIFNTKANKWVKGRKNWKNELREKVGDQNDLFWIHCSSLGEFEQGRPLIEALQEKGQKVLLTFFSPSGYENQKNFKAAFHVAYLPLDSLLNAKAFIDIVNPKAAFFVKYEFWFNYMKVLKTKKIPLYIVSGIFRRDQYFFKTYGKWFSRQLKSIEHFFVQNEQSKLLLKSIDIEQVSICGDTRFDRVVRISSNPLKLENVKNFTENSSVIIGGSTWLEDEKIISKAYFKYENVKFIIVPHEVNEGRMKEINELFNNEGIYLSEIDSSDNSGRLLIVDSVGKLSSLYQYAHFAFIGGGFGKGIHNTLEAAAYSLPIAFGPNFSKFQEAQDLVERKGAFVIEEAGQLLTFIEKVIQENEGQKLGSINRKYVEEKQGATSKILNELSQSSLI